VWLTALLGLGLGGCTESETTPAPTKPVVILSASLPTQTLTAANTYLLKGFAYVDADVTLTIEPGTVIKGDRTTSGTLVVRQGGKLMASGTAAKPIVFTSNFAPGKRNPGDWGGIILCGKAPVNQPGGVAQIEGGPIAAYGGTDAADNSGSLQYVRIEYGGIAFGADNEVNGLTLAGVGNGTTIDHVQVSFSGDDAFEWFGGTVNCSYLVAHRGVDDMFDTDNGYSGQVQFALGIADPNNSDQPGVSNGFESDNDAAGTSNTPQTRAQFANVTLLGPLATTTTEVGPFGNKLTSGALLRRNSAESLYNTVLAGWPEGVRLGGSASEANYIANVLQLQGVAITGTPTAKTLLATTAGFDFSTPFSAATQLNQLLTNNTDLGLGLSAFALNAPNPMPAAGSGLLDATKVAVLPGGFQAAPYRGAFGTTNWLAGWTSFDPQNTTY
jgi:hypothetical protein